MKRCIFILAAIVLTTAMVACGNNNSTTQNNDNSTTTYTDDYGSIVNIPTHPRRVVSLSPAVTEIMFALGADSLLVGRTEFCVYPPEAATIENIGGISNLNIEKVLSRNPDLIISGSMVPQKVVEQFAKMGVPLVCVIEKQKFEGLYENIDKIGRLVDCMDKADSLNKRLIAQTNEYLRASQTNGQKTKPTVYYVVGFGSGGNFTAGGNTFINDIITLAGGDNIAKDCEGWTFSLEALMEADPTYILIRAEDSARFCQTKPYNQLTAVKKGKLIALEDGILDLQVPRNIILLRRLKNLFSGE